MVVLFMPDISDFLSSALIAFRPDARHIRSFLEPISFLTRALVTKTRKSCMKGKDMKTNLKKLLAASGGIARTTSVGGGIWCRRPAGATRTRQAAVRVSTRRANRDEPRGKIASSKVKPALCSIPVPSWPMVK